MFEISWSEILVVGVVALIVVGPKELPVLLRTVGKYMGMVKRQASEFRAQFDEAMREAELDQLRKDVESIKTEAESTLREAEHSVSREIHDARREFDNMSAGYHAPLEPAAAPSEPSALGSEAASHDSGHGDAAQLSAGSSAGSAAIAAATAAAAAAAPTDPLKSEHPSPDRAPEKTGA